MLAVAVMALVQPLSVHHSYSEAALRGPTSASRQENAPIANISRHEADLVGLTSASRQIDKNIRKDMTYPFGCFCYLVRIILY